MRSRVGPTGGTGPRGIAGPTGGAWGPRGGGRAQRGRVGPTHQPQQVPPLLEGGAAAQHAGNHDDDSGHHQDVGCGLVGARGQQADVVTLEGQGPDTHCHDGQAGQLRTTRRVSEPRVGARGRGRGRPTHPEAAVVAKQQILKADGAICGFLLVELAHPGAARGTGQPEGWRATRA